MMTSISNDNENTEVLATSNTTFFLLFYALYTAVQQKVCGHIK